METYKEESHIEETHTENHGDNSHNNDELRNDSPVVRYALIVVVIVILFFVSLGIVNFVPKLFSSISGSSSYFSTLFGGNKDLEVSTNTKEVNSGEEFVLNWKNNTEDKDGIYNLNFKCVQGIKVEYQTRDGLRPVICNTTFPLPQEIYSFPFTVTSLNTKKTTLSFTVNFSDKDTNKSKLKNDGEIVVLPKEAKVNETVSTTATSSQTSNPPRLYSPPVVTTNTQAEDKSAPQTSNEATYPKPTPEKAPAKTYSGSPDLAIRLVDVGWVDNFTNFHSGTSIPNGARVLVKFNVSNRGTAPTGAWTVNALLPTKIYYERSFYSQTEPTVFPGATFDLNLAFDEFDPSAGNLFISLNNSADQNVVNNSISVPLYVR